MNFNNMFNSINPTFVKLFFTSTVPDLVFGLKKTDGNYFWGYQHFRNIVFLLKNMPLNGANDNLKGEIITQLFAFCFNLVTTALFIFALPCCSKTFSQIFWRPFKKRKYLYTNLISNSILFPFQFIVVPFYNIVELFLFHYLLLEARVIVEFKYAFNADS